MVAFNIPYHQRHIDTLDAEIAAFDPGTHDVNDPDGAWNGIRLAAMTLASQFFSVCNVGGIDGQPLTPSVLDALKRAKDIMPANVDARVIELIQSHMDDIAALGLTNYLIENDLLEP